MCEQDIEARCARDLERYHRRTAERRARGLCLNCGKRPPTPHRSQCEPCAEKRRPADRTRHHRRTAERTAHGLCPKCGRCPPAPGRTLCEPRGQKRNKASRARDARLRAGGMPCRDPERARASSRARDRRQAAERGAAGLCSRCEKVPAAPDLSVCEPCGEKRRARERARYAKARELEIGWMSQFLRQRNSPIKSALISFTSAIWRAAAMLERIACSQV